MEAKYLGLHQRTKWVIRQELVVWICAVDFVVV